MMSWLTQVVSIRTRLGTTIRQTQRPKLPLQSPSRLGPALHPRNIIARPGPHMTAPVDNLDALAAELSRLSTSEAKMEALSRWVKRSQKDETPSVFLNSKGTTTGLDQPRDELQQDKLTELLNLHGISPKILYDQFSEGIGGIEVMLDRVPCANVDASKGISCSNAASLACANCKLVIYCSKACQKSHWRTHKQDCNDPIRSAKWQPAWAVERRAPTFVSDDAPSPGSSTDWRTRHDKLAFGLSLWGNMPAMDVLKVTNNEGNFKKQDFSLAFIASGDLRNVILSVNSLPLDYSGKLNILLNDRIPHIVVRNLVLLIILGQTTDLNKSVDIALHAWYSAFLPMDYLIHVMITATNFITAQAPSEPFEVKIGPRSAIKGFLSSEGSACLASMITSQYTVADVNSELNRVMFAPQRRDWWHRRCCGAEPTHRLALLEYRRFGLVYPFGAANHHFNAPNRLLFDQDGQWLQSDSDDPLKSWDITSVIEAGSRHGALRGDLYGCLYFYLREQLRAFAERLTRFDITFQMVCNDASALSAEIKDGSLARLVPSSISFDRIEVSNTLDSEYIGIPRLLADWSPFLKRTPHAAIVGYFMNWVPKQSGSSITTSDRQAFEPAMDRLMKDGRWAHLSPTDVASMAMLGQISQLTAYLDNYAAFKEYLSKFGMDDALRQQNLALRQVNKIIPHRLCAPLDAKPNALPVFTNDDSWYLHAILGQWLWSERFVEIVRQD